MSESSDVRPCLYEGCDGAPAVAEFDHYFCSETCAAMYGVAAVEDQWEWDEERQEWLFLMDIVMEEEACK